MAQDVNELHGEVAGKPAGRESVMHFIRGLVDMIEDACNGNDWNKVRRIAADTDTHAEELASAMEAEPEAEAKAE